MGIGVAGAVGGIADVDDAHLDFVLGDGLDLPIRAGAAAAGKAQRHNGGQGDGQ